MKDPKDSEVYVSVAVSGASGADPCGVMSLFLYTRDIISLSLSLSLLSPCALESLTYLSSLLSFLPPLFLVVNMSAHMHANMHTHTHTCKRSSVPPLLNCI